MYPLDSKTWKRKALLPPQQGSPGGRGKPPLHPPLKPPYLRGAQRVDAPLQRLAEAAIGLLHALHLKRPRNDPSNSPAGEAREAREAGETDREARETNACACHQHSSWPPSTQLTPPSNWASSPLASSPHHSPLHTAPSFLRPPPGA